MRIGIITPAPPGSRHGNRITALRWQRILRGLGHRVTVAEQYEDDSYDVMIALHARRSYPAIRRFHLKHPEAPVIVALTGTDLYQNLSRSRKAQQSLTLGARLIVLQPKALEELPPEVRKKARVIFQSVAARRKVASGRSNAVTGGRAFEVCVIAHLRSVKDPLRAAEAAQLLPHDSRVRVIHLGRAMSAKWALQAQAEMKINARYQWLSEQPRADVFRRLRRSQLFVISSRLEGGANALGEAIAAGVPVLASRIPGNVGILGKNYPGYFPARDTKALASLLARAETDSRFLTALENHCKKVAPLFDPRREREAWAKLLGEIVS